MRNFIVHLVVFFLLLPFDNYCQNSTGFDVSTAVYNQSYYLRSSANGYVLTPNSIKFNNDGSKMFILDAFGNNTGKVKEYHLSTAFDISSSNYITDLYSRTYRYLQNMDKSDLSHEYFGRSLLRLIND